MSFGQPCRTIVRHVSTLFQHNTKRADRGISLSLCLQQAATSYRRTLTQTNHGQAVLRNFSTGNTHRQTSTSDISTVSKVDETPQHHMESHTVLDLHRVKEAEQGLYEIVKRLRHAPNELAQDYPSTTALDDIWQVFSQLIQSNQEQAHVSFSSPSPIDLPLHQLRKLAPYAPFVANVIEEYMSTAQGERKDLFVKAARLSQWGLLSSILFGTPTIPAIPIASTDGSSSSAVPRRGDSLSQSPGQPSVQEIPQSRWPARSTKSRAPVQSKSKLAQMHEIESCRNVYLTLLLAIGTHSSAEGNTSSDGLAAARTFIEETVAALDTNIQALLARQKNNDKSRLLLQHATQERATVSVMELLARWIEAVPWVKGETTATAVSSGIAAVPRILYRESMREIAAKLRQRLGHDLADDNEINIILGFCLVQNSDNLASRLHRLMKQKNKDELLFLWQACSSILEAQSDNETRTSLVSLFLMTALANRSDSKFQSDELQAVLAGIYSLLPRPTPLPVYHSLLSLYAGINTLSSPDHQETGNTVVSSQASLQNLLATWSRMKAERVTPDIKAYTILMTGLGKKGDYQGLQRVWEELVNDAGCKALWQKEEGTAEAYPPVRILNHFISTLFNLPTVTGSSTLALSLFDYVCDPKSAYQPDMFSINIVLRHYARKKDLDAIIRLMDRLPSFRLTPDLVTYTTLIGGLLDAGRPDTAKGILDVMQKTGVQPNAYVYSLLIADLAKKGTPEAMKSAEALLQQMKAVGLKATAVTWTALASGYFRAHMVREGLSAIKRSQDKGVELTRVSYNMVLRSILYSDMDAVPAAEIEHFFRGKLGGSQRIPAISNRSTDASLLLLQNMIDNHIEPDLDTWQLVLDSLSRQEKWTQADSVIQLMYSRRFIVKEGSLLARVVQQIRNREKTRRR